MDTFLPLVERLGVPVAFLTIALIAMVRGDVAFSWYPVVMVGRVGGKGTLSARWRGGRRLGSGGYIVLWHPEKGTVYEHRWVMEQFLGRALASNEWVHHINGNKQDNRLENLRLVSGREHNLLHGRNQPSGRWSLRYLACVRCGRTRLRHVAHGLCASCYQNRVRHLHREHENARKRAYRARRRLRRAGK